MKAKLWCIALAAGFLGACTLATVPAPKNSTINCARMSGDSFHCQMSDTHQVPVTWTVYGNAPEDPTRFAEGPSASFPLPKKDGGVLELSYEDAKGKHFLRILIAWIGDRISFREDRWWHY